MTCDPYPDSLRPEPPEPPLPGDCCDGGCDPCIHELHAEALAHHARLLAAWQAAHPPEATGDAGIQAASAHE